METTHWRDLIIYDPINSNKTEGTLGQLVDKGNYVQHIDGDNNDYWLINPKGKVGREFLEDPDAEDGPYSGGGFSGPDGEIDWTGYPEAVSSLGGTVKWGEYGEP